MCIVLGVFSFLCGLHLQHILRQIAEENKQSLREADWSRLEDPCHWVTKIALHFRKSAKKSFKMRTVEQPRESDETEPFYEFDPGHRDAVLAKRSGYIRSADLQSLAHQLRHERPPLQLCFSGRVMVGTFITEGTVLVSE